MDISEDENNDFSSDDSLKDPEYTYSSDEEDDNLQERLEDMELEETAEENENDEISNCELLGSSDVEWGNYRGRHKLFNFMGKSGLQLDLPTNISGFDTFALFFDEEVINLIVTETNIYAEQTIKRNRITRHSRLNKWIPTDAEEMKNFFGLFMWMGLVRMGNITSYWSTKLVYKNTIAPSVMSRNRFELLLRLLHFSNNENIIPGDRLAKIQPLVDLLEIKYKNAFVPGEDYVIDETLVPWRGRLIFRQYIPNKAHKYGVKLFKLCSSEGYTWASKIYSGKSEMFDKNYGLAAKVCEDLSQGLLNKGRTLYVDNFYTSYPLALAFIRQKTHVVGTIRANKKWMPKEVMNAKLKRGEMIAKEDKNGIVVLNWLDTRNVRLLTTKHAPKMVDINVTFAGTSKRKNNKQKPLPICDYNKGKSGIDISDQMGSYATTLRKGIKWYRKLAIEYVLGISVVNAYIIYKIATKSNIGIRQFRENLVSDLLSLSLETTNKPKTNIHTLKTMYDSERKKVRRMCSGCYAQIKETEGREAARRKGKKVTTYCLNCEQQPFFCLECFGQHNKSI